MMDKISGIKTNPKILLIDDSNIFLKGMNSILKPLTHNIFQATDGESGLELVEKHTFDLVITDIAMPGIDGLELCRRLRSNESTRTTPIILVSQFDTQKDILKGFQTGANAYVPKHEISDRLLNTAQDILQKNEIYKLKTILVVEDSPVIGAMICTFLEDNGFNTIRVEDGLEAEKVLNRNKVNLILSDIEMPKMSGLELCRRVKESNELQTIPFITMSVHSERSYIRNSMHLGSDAFIVKPFNMEELLSLVERILSEEFNRVLVDKEHLLKEQILFLRSMESLISALEARDKYTRGHSEAVADISCGMAKMSGADNDAIEAYKLSGRLHDIGKIGVRDDVLLKPGALTNKEYKLIQEHPTIGTKILSPIPSLHRTLNVILYHHERFDGKGYPKGLKGDQIPMEARITAVADCYHALTSNRPYRKGMPESKALQILHDTRGTQLFPDCVDLFMEWKVSTG
jgi:response regulator RpfG family c-di-GMP phosphodiesterase